MAKVISLFPMSGTIGNVTLRRTKEGCVAQSKCGPTRDQVLYSDDFKHTRLNASEFQIASQHGTLLRRAMGIALDGLKFKNLNARMNGVFRRMANSDGTSKWGKREWTKGEVEKLKGFEFNDALPMDEVLPVEITHRMDVATGNVRVSIPPFKVRQPEARPEAATHFRILSCVVSVDFEKGRYQQCVKEGAILSLKKRQAEPLHFEHVLVPKPGELLIHMVGIEFYEVVGDKFVLITKGAMRVVEVARDQLDGKVEVVAEEVEVVEGVVAVSLAEPVGIQPVYHSYTMNGIGFTSTSTGGVGWGKVQWKYAVCEVLYG